MIYLWACDRRRFVDFIANREPLKSGDVQSTDTIEGNALRGDDILLVWKTSPSEIFSLPHAAIVADSSMTDFLAWVSTYFKHIRPFTAHCRVLTPSLSYLLAESIPFPSLPDVGSADIGLVLAEGIAYSVGRTDLKRLPFSAFARTLSFAFADGAKRYEQMFADDGRVFEQIKSGWLSARKLSNQPSLDLSPADISDVWLLTLSAVGNGGPNPAKAKSEPLVVKALQGVRANGQIPSDTWKKILGRFQKSNLLIEAMEGPREGRVKAVEAIIQELARGSSESRMHRAFIVGYMASRIQPGSLDHFPLLFPCIPDLRESLLWYGVCSGLSPESSIDNYGNGLGLMMKRELGRPSHWLDRPNCDIALSEMAILLRERDDMKLSLRTHASGALKVEIFPLINTSVKWSESGGDYVRERDTLAGKQSTLFNEDTRMRKDVLEILSMIEESYKSLDAIRKQVEKKFGESVRKSRKRQK